MEKGRALSRLVLPRSRVQRGDQTAGGNQAGTSSQGLAPKSGTLGVALLHKAALPAKVKSLPDSLSTRDKVFHAV